MLALMSRLADAAAARMSVPGGGGGPQKPTAALGATEAAYWLAGGARGRAGQGRGGGSRWRALARSRVRCCPVLRCTSSWVVDKAGTRPGR